MPVAVNTELRRAWFAALRDQAESFAPGACLLALQAALTDRLAATAAEHLETLAPQHDERH
ncbi:MAG TPA: hypothetical protein VGM91_18070 [Conexibacter sp.]|jgi:hypothetical protein